MAPAKKSVEATALAETSPSEKHVAMDDTPGSQGVEDQGVREMAAALKKSVIRS